MNRLKNIKFTLSVGELYGMQIISQLSVCSCFLNGCAFPIQRGMGQRVSLLFAQSQARGGSIAICEMDQVGVSISPTFNVYLAKVGIQI